MSYSPYKKTVYTPIKRLSRADRRVRRSRHQYEEGTTSEEWAEDLLETSENLVEQCQFLEGQLDHTEQKLELLEQKIHTLEEEAEETKNGLQLRQDKIDLQKETIDTYRCKAGSFDKKTTRSMRTWGPPSKSEARRTRRKRKNRSVPKRRLKIEKWPGAGIHTLKSPQ